MRKILISFYLVFFLLIPPAYANSAKIIFDEAIKAYNEKNYDRAIELFEKTIEIVPNLAQAYHHLGLAYKAKGIHLEEVVWLMETAVEIDPHYVQAYDSLAKVYYNLGDYKKAEEYSLKAIELDPSLLNPYLSLAWVYLLGQSNPDQAIFYFKYVTDRAQIPLAYFGLGMAYFMNHERSQVLEMITLLRKFKREDLALHLENMIRDKQYKPQSEEGQPIPVLTEQASYQNSGITLKEEKIKGAQEEMRGEPKVPGFMPGDEDYVAASEEQNSNAVLRIESLRKKRLAARSSEDFK